MLTKQQWVGLPLAVILVASILLASCQPQVVTVTVKETVPVEQTVAVKETVVVQQTVQVAVPETTGLRKLKGKLSVAAMGVLPVPGAPSTKRQQAWTTLLAQYKKLQPDIEVVIEDLPIDSNGELWCNTKKDAKKMPDVTFVDECNWFRPTPADKAAGNIITTNFTPFENEINPYTGTPWKDDWINDTVRKGRCIEGGLTDYWGCQTVRYDASVIYVNWDILKEYGVTAWPKTRQELWDLSAKINKDGKYQAWDNNVDSSHNYIQSMPVNLTMDIFTKLGCNPNETGDEVMACQIGLFNPPTTEVNFCNKTYWISENPSLQEAIKQLKLFTDASGGVAFFDPARDQNGQAWLTGKAALRYDNTGFIGRMNQAKDDGVLAVKNWEMQFWPNLTQADLIDKNVKIWYDGQAYQFSGAQGDVFAPTPNVRASGEDPNVDLMARDFLQFMSSPTGQMRDVTEGILPVNPIALQFADPAVRNVFNMRPAVYNGWGFPAGGAPLSEQYYEGDPDFNVQAWLTGAIPDFTDAMVKADESTTLNKVKLLNDALKDLNITMPEVCKPWMPQ